MVCKTSSGPIQCHCLSSSGHKRTTLCFPFRFSTSGSKFWITRMWWSVAHFSSLRLLSQPSPLVACAPSYKDHTSFSTAHEKTGRHSRSVRLTQRSWWPSWLPGSYSGCIQGRLEENRNMTPQTGSCYSSRGNHSHGPQRSSDGALVNEIWWST